MASTRYKGQLLGYGIAGCFLLVVMLLILAHLGSDVSEASHSGEGIAQVSSSSEVESISDYAVGQTAVGYVQSYTSEESLVDTGKRVLDEYSQKNQCRPLVYGFIDLQGKVWACVMMTDCGCDCIFIRDSDARVDVKIVGIDNEKLNFDSWL